MFVFTLCYLVMQSPYLLGQAQGEESTKMWSNFRRTQSANLPVNRARDPTFWNFSPFRGEQPRVEDNEVKKDFSRFPETSGGRLQANNVGNDDSFIAFDDDSVINRRQFFDDSFPKPLPGFPNQRPYFLDFPPQNGFTTPTTTTRTTTVAVPGMETRRPPCEEACQTTPEYNPVCGDDNITYANMGRLRCALRCGKNVRIQFRGACPVLVRGR